MNTLATSAAPPPGIPWYTRYGLWVIVCAAFAGVVAGQLQTVTNELTATVTGVYHSQTPRLAECGEPLPQAYHCAGSVEEATQLQAAINAKQDLRDEAWTYHWWDLAFMASYGALFFVGAHWARQRGEILAAATGGGFGTRLKKFAWIGGAGSLLAVGADFAEFLLCATLLSGAPVTKGLLFLLKIVWLLKWIGVGAGGLVLLTGLAALLALPAARQALLAHWELLVRVWGFVMKARFSLLIGALFTLLLLTAPGQDIVRSIARGEFRSEAETGWRLDVPRLGWFAIGLLVLSATCWGWARLLFAFHLQAPEDRPKRLSSRSGSVEERLRQDLPVYYGSAPFVVAAAAFAVAPLREKTGGLTTSHFFAASLPVLWIFFLLPWLLVALRADADVPRRSFGALSRTLVAYTVLAAVHAALSWHELHALGLVPLLLILVALGLYGLARAETVLVLLLALLFAAVVGGQLIAALPSMLVLLALCGFALWFGRDWQPEELDRLQLSVQLRPGAMLLRLVRTSTATPPEGLTAEQFRHLRPLIGLCLALLGLQILLFFGVLALPQALPGCLGSAAVLALGLAGWATIGSALMAAFATVRFPIVSVALLFAVLCSVVMDNHQIRLVKTDGAIVQRLREGEDSHAVGNAFARWKSAVGTGASLNAARKPPCIIVATEGGGIRAAFWTASVLATLQDASVADPRRAGRPDFASHVFAISGVSGGSVGAAFFTALCAGKEREKGRLRELAAQLLGRDHLAPALAALLYPDAVQRFLPLRLLPDRAKALEGSWELAWRELTGTDTMAQSFLGLWSRPPEAPWLPALFLNGTLVERGKRIIASNLPIETGEGGEFIDAHDLYAHLRALGPDAGTWRDVALSTGALTSARFPLVSPPARLPSGLRIMDGGYFENSGATTGLDVARAAYQEPFDTPLLFLFLRYGETPAFSDLLPQSGPHPAPVNDLGWIPPQMLCNETASVFGPLVQTRDGRGSYAQDAVANRYAAADLKMEILSFTFTGQKIPLSWSLSRVSCRSMLEQIPADFTARKSDNRTDLGANIGAATAVLEMLYGDAAK